MNQELKEQAHKEFDDFFSELLSVDNDGFQKTYQKLHLMPMIYKFLDSILDKTVQYERERIAKWVDKNTGPGGDTPYPELICFIAEEKDFDVAIKSLITNKSDINK